MSLGGKSAGGSFLEDGSAIIVTGIDTASIITGSGGYYFTINQNFTGLGDYVTASKVTPDATTIAFASRIQFNVFTGSLGNYT